MHWFLLFLAAFCAGAINSVAGGGTLLTFPALLAAGLSSVAANATSTIALVPGAISAFWGYRREVGSDRAALLWMGLPSLAGGLIGARLVITMKDAQFSTLIPGLIFGATALFIIQEPIRRMMERRSASTENRESNPAQGRWLGVMCFQFLVALYGGFFGAGIGILMLAALGLLGLSNIHRMNALKNFAAICINGVAAVTFAFSHRVNWPIALLMAVAAILGGSLGAGVAQRLGQSTVRWIVIAIGIGIGVFMLVHPIKPSAHV